MEESGSGSNSPDDQDTQLLRDERSIGSNSPDGSEQLDENEDALLASDTEESTNDVPSNSDTQQMMESQSPTEPQSTSEQQTPTDPEHPVERQSPVRAQTPSASQSPFGLQSPAESQNPSDLTTGNCSMEDMPVQVKTEKGNTGSSVRTSASPEELASPAVPASPEAPASPVEPASPMEPTSPIDTLAPPVREIKMERTTPEKDLLAKPSHSKTDKRLEEHTDDHVELDYGDDDITEPPHETVDLTQTETVDLTQDEEKPLRRSHIRKQHTGDSDEGGLSEEEGEVLSEEEALPNRPRNDDVEEGEIDDGRRAFARTQLCRFFIRGQCTWGYMCRFLHPGVNDKGNYSLIDRPGMNPAPCPQPRQDQEAKSPTRNDSREPTPEVVGPSKPETSWERGIIQAKEALKRASRKREMELDIEDKKMNLSLNDLENKENERKNRDPYYDSLQYDELDPIVATSFGADAPLADEDWDRMGFEEHFDVDWTRAHYEPPYGHEAHPAEQQRYWQEDRVYRGDGERRNHRDRGGDRGRPQHRRRRTPPREGRGWRDEGPSDRRDPRQALGSDGWVDPWQRTREKPAARHRRASSGSSSFSSVSGSSRDSSASSFSSRSRSRTRTPTPLRNVSKPPKSTAGKSKEGAASPTKARRGIGPDWVQGPPRRDPREPLPTLPPPLKHASIPVPDNREQPAALPSAKVTKARATRKDVPPGKGDRARKRSGTSSSSSSSSDSSSDSSRSSSSSGSNSSSSDSSSSDSSSDSDDIYSGIDKMAKEKKRHKKTSDRRPAKTVSKRSPTRKAAAIKESVNTVASKGGIKLTLVNKSKVQPKKRVLDSPPPDTLPPNKKANVQPAEKETKVSRPAKSAVSKPSAPAKPSKKAQPNRREELLQQLKAVEDAIAKKRGK